MNNEHLKWSKVAYDYVVLNYYNRIEKIKKETIKILMQLFGSHKVAIQGAGKHTEELLKLIDVHRNIVCIIDNGRNGNMYDIPICKESNIHQYKYDLILISSYVYREEFIKVCRKYCDYDQIIDIYQILEQRGYFIH